MKITSLRLMKSDNGRVCPPLEFYEPLQIRGTKELNFSCKPSWNYLQSLIIYFDFDKPFFEINPNEYGYIIPISFLESGNHSFTFVTYISYYHPTYELNITDPPPIKIENNKLEKENYYKTTENSLKLIYDIEFPSNVLYSFNYYFDNNYDSKITEYIYGRNDNDHIERSINLPSSLTSSDHKLHYFFNATGLTTDTFENSFSLIYHKPIINLLTENDKFNPPIYIRSVNDTIRIGLNIEDEDPNDNVTIIVSIESTSISQAISKIVPDQIITNLELGNQLEKGGKRISISANDKYGYSSSTMSYFYFIYKYNKPEIEFQSENNISRIENFVRVHCRVRDYRGNGMLTIEANLTNDILNYTNTKDCDIDDDSFKDVFIDIPINRYYEGNLIISLCVSNRYDEVSSIITSIFSLDEIPTFNAIDNIKKFRKPNKSIPFIYSLISNK
ncbi:hypothetical protein TVAG_482760 [Trichomonas vaginalis G3]|uniref:Uncharacterized protein n=1 Tax=Trichomonas vaginalis (strain ATCC PRA-98 / G3) TaxID=412133 RepID=A2FRR1_TRIV3|nr:hypothetical protein TVAG_482760 [Trichomonas vaginalis G3]|eukprot:XP_001305330.1 hypothetical protein [Trichomonas vaginalis G3]